MTTYKKFDQIVEELNQRISKSETLLSFLQTERAVKNNAKRIGRKFFNENAKMFSHKYSFHFGGSWELQFNISAEPEFKGEPVFRYGFAFSLHASQSLNDPLGVHEPNRKRFNSLIQQFPNYFQDETMWVWSKGQRTEPFKVRKIKGGDFQVGNFIFIGKFLTKGIEQISSDDLDEIISELEYLYPAYRFIQLVDDKAISQEKVARICWNDEGWKQPSGLEGKSSNKNSYERQYGFGHEEWLLDLEKVIDGYHYAALQPIQRFRKKYEGEKFNIHLYTIDSETNTRYWIGLLKGVEVIRETKSKDIVKIYKKNGWYNEMKSNLKEQVKNNKAVKELDMWANSGDLFSIRFKPENYIAVDEATLVNPKDKAIPIARYILLNYTKLPKELEQNNTFEIDPSSGRRKLKSSAIKNPAKSSTEYLLLHNDISTSLEEYLKSQKKMIVAPENKTGLGTRIDMVTEKGGEIVFYEIKTYPTVKQSLRSAIGQLFEYSYYPDRQLAHKLIVVSDRKALKSDKLYLKNLRSQTGLEIYYWNYSIRKKKVLEVV